mgnify:CR=1 FL=1
MRLILPILSFLSLSATAQQKWYEPTKKEIIGTVCLSLSGMYKGFHEAINYRGYGKGEKFWDIRTRGRNKYKNWPNDTRERFPGSKTIFVVFTDGNHLTAAANTVTLIGGSYFVLSDIKDEWKQYKGWQKVGYIIVRKLGPYLIRSFIFEKVYKTL